MKVYLSGQVTGSYRSQNIIKILGDNTIPFQMFPMDYYFFSSKNKPLFLVLASLFFILTVPMRALCIAMASHVVVLPMNSSPVVIFEIILAKILSKRIVSDFYISAYDTVVNDRKLVKPRSLKARIKKAADKVIIKFSTDIIFLNKSEASYYLKVAQVESVTASQHVIPLCVDLKKELFECESHNVEKKEGPFTICWWGTYIPLHGLENIINAFCHLKEVNVKLYLLGDSSDKAVPYIDLIASLNLSETIIVRNDLSFANGNLAPFLKENCDLALGNFGTSEKAKTVLVNKVVDALSLGIPCLTMETKATSELLDNGEGVVFCAPDPQRIADKIYTLSTNRSYLNQVGQKGITAYFERFSPDAFKIKFLKILRNE